MEVLYSHGDSVVWGAELDDKKNERFSYHISDGLKMVDCNNASSGVSNDFIYRQTMRDISHWLENGVVWSEETGWINATKLTIIIGWTSPTRFEWWDGKKYQQERLWEGYDKWGDPDKDKTAEDEFVLNQTSDIPSYIRTFNYIISLSAFLENHNISYYFFNSFYKYKLPLEPKYSIDNYGRPNFQLGLNSLWSQLPNEFKCRTMYEYINFVNEGFLPRNHQTKKSHKEWAQFLINKINV